MQSLPRHWLEVPRLAEASAMVDFADECGRALDHFSQACRWLALGADTAIAPYDPWDWIGWALFRAGLCEQEPECSR